jgi:hypothetical protein
MGVKSFQSFSHELQLIVFSKTKRPIFTYSNLPTKYKNPDIPSNHKDLENWKNGGTEDLTMIHIVDKLCPKICHVHPIAPTKLTNETPLITYTQCASRGP